MWRIGGERGELVENWWRIRTDCVSRDKAPSTVVARVSGGIIVHIKHGEVTASLYKLGAWIVTGNTFCALKLVNLSKPIYEHLMKNL